MTLQEKIKELAERLDTQVPCPISGQCFSEVMQSEAGMELFAFIGDAVLGFFSTDDAPIKDYTWWDRFTKGKND